jgi:hypothetical protein
MFFGGHVGTAILRSLLFRLSERFHTSRPNKRFRYITEPTPTPLPPPRPGGWLAEVSVNYFWAFLENFRFNTNMYPAEKAAVYTPEFNDLHTQWLQDLHFIPCVPFSPRSPVNLSTNNFLHLGQRNTQIKTGIVTRIAIIEKPSPEEVKSAMLSIAD